MAYFWNWIFFKIFREDFFKRGDFWIWPKLVRILIFSRILLGKSYLENTSKEVLSKSSGSLFKVARSLLSYFCNWLYLTFREKTSLEVFRRMTFPEVFSPGQRFDQSPELNLRRLLKKTSKEVFSLILNVLLLFFNCKSNPRRLLPASRRLRENFQKTYVEVFARKTSLEVF